ncbi:hypothetical protein PVAND_004810 [Polypedilum vanderplanki]|uniref:WD repeat-containing protein 65 n=1 Tax=Polypedilum vanderplanki TaxID=319348 RepID=A0A9J6BY22_POLVA|nr:hypothetical protein PVAND_004810 [Polypedilum vanderplanki]
MNALMKFQKFRQIKQQQMQNKTVGLQPKRLFGLRNDVLGNIHFTMTKYEIIYPAANVIVIQNFVTNEQKFLRLPENINPEIIVISPNRKLIAIAELNIITEKTTIAIYDIEELKRLKTLQLAVECPIQAVGNMCFTSDSRGMAVLSREPDAFITIYTFGKNDTMVTGRASNKNYPGRATLVKCNPSDTSIITVGGENMMKIMNKTEKGFGQLGTIKGDNIDVTALTWLSGEIIIAGSAKMELFFIEGGELKAQYNMTDVDVIDLTQPDADETSQRQSTIVHLLATKTYPIKCLTTFKTGFAFATHNMVHVFQKESSHKFIKTTLLVIPVQLFDASLYVISNIAVNEEEDTIVATTQHSQLFVGQLFAPETIGISQIEFKFLGEPLHIDSIIDLSVCSWKPIIMTLSKDLTVRIWNYETMKVELIKKFLIDLRCISLHPSGFIAAIAFTDIVRFYQIQLRDLKLLKSFNYSRTTVLQFSHRGHLIAIGCQKEISIVCVFTFETHHTLVGHKDVLSVAWSTDDRYLVSSGKEGSVYEWDLTTGQRINELVQKGTLYRSLAVSSDQSYIVGVTHTAFLREISKSELIREFRAPDDSPLTTLAFSRSDQMLFAANERGCLYNIKMPFLESGGGNFSNYRFYHKAINKLCITYDDSTLVSVGDDGTLVFWAITNAEIKMAEMDSDLGHIEDVLIARQELLEIEHQMNLLQMRINEQVSEFMYEKEQGESYFTDQMNDIHAKYSEEINELRQKFVQQDAYHIEQLNELTMTLTKSNEKHQREVEELEANFNEKIIVEYENQKALKKKVDEVIELYEEKLRKSSSCLQETIDGLEANFKKQIEEKNEYVETLMKEMKDKEKEFQEYCRQVEIDRKFYF